MSWVFFIILATALYAIANIIDSHVINKKINNALFVLSVGYLSYFIIALVILIIFPLENISSKVMGLVLLSIIFNFLCVWLYYKTLSIEEVSRVIPIFFVYPVFSTFLAVIFLGESLDFIKCLAIALAVLGALLISIKRNAKKLKFSKAIGLILISSFLYSSLLVVDKYILSEISYWNLFSIKFTIYPVLVFILAFLVFKKKILVFLEKEKVKKGIPLVLMTFGIGALATIMIYIALTKTSVINLVVIDVTQPLFVFIFSLFVTLFLPKMLKERFDPRTLILKLIATILIISAGILIAIN